MADNGFKIDDIKKVINNLNLTEEEVLKAAIKGTRLTGLNIAGEAGKIVPRETGTLARAIVVTVGGEAKETDKIYKEAQENKGLRTGRQVDSLTTEQTLTKAKQGGIEVTISANTPYARKQHENTELKHKMGQQAKYLEIPFNAKKGDLQKNVSFEIQKVLKKNTPI